MPVEHELVMVVRKELAISLRDLMQHGLMEVSSLIFDQLYILPVNTELLYLSVLTCYSVSSRGVEYCVCQCVDSNV